MSVPTLADLIANWRDVLLNYSPLTSYCTNTLGSSLTLFVGLDDKNPPKISECPFILIDPVGSQSGISDAEFSWGSVIHMGIEDNTYSDYNSTGATEMRGFYRIDTIWNHIKDALEADALGKNLMMDSAQYTIMTEALPLIQAKAQIEARFTNTIGANFTL